MNKGEDSAAIAGGADGSVGAVKEEDEVDYVALCLAEAEKYKDCPPAKIPKASIFDTLRLMDDDIKDTALKVVTTVAVVAGAVALGAYVAPKAAGHVKSGFSDAMDKIDPDDWSILDDIEPYFNGCEWVHELKPDM